MSARGAAMKRDKKMLLDALRQAGAEIKGSSIKCPFHKDRTPSGSVYQDSEGVWRFKCHAASCGFCGDVFDVQSRASNRPLKGILQENREPPKSKAAVKSSKPQKAYSTIEQAARAVEKQVAGRYVAKWPYQNQDGGECFWMLRFDLTKGGKTYRPIHRNGNRYVLGDPPGLLPLYGLLNLNGQDRVYLVEGEKCADAARFIGLTAVTSAHGAESPDKSDWSVLAGREVVILPDADDAGNRYATGVARILTAQSPPAKVKIIRLPDLTDGQDIVDHIERLDSRESEDIARGIEEMAERAEVFDPMDFIDGPVLICVADVKSEPIDWLWPQRIALGKLTIIAGDPGLGKSLLTLYLAARVSRGGKWPDNPDVPAACGNVVLLSAEDDVADTIRPRLDAAEADVSKIVVLQAVRKVDPHTDSIHEEMFSLDRDLPALEEAIKRTGNVKLLVVDPITAYLGKTDSHKNADIRSLLAPLSNLAARYKVAAVAVSHLNKNAGNSSIYRTMGSLAFVAAARAVWVVTQDKDNPARRLFLPVKNNIAKDSFGLAYSVMDSQSYPGIGIVAWEPDPVTITADQALALDSTDMDERNAMKEAVSWLTETLSSGKVLSNDVYNWAKEAGIARRTLERAKQRLNIQSIREGSGQGSKCYWNLPS